MILTHNGCKLFIKQICQFDIYMAEIHIHVNYNHHTSITGIFDLKKMLQSYSLPRRHRVQTQNFHVPVSTVTAISGWGVTTQVYYS